MYHHTHTFRRFLIEYTRVAEVCLIFEEISIVFESMLTQIKKASELVLRSLFLYSEFNFTNYAIFFSKAYSYIYKGNKKSPAVLATGLLIESRCSVNGNTTVLPRHVMRVRIPSPALFNFHTKRPIRR